LSHYNSKTRVRVGSGLSEEFPVEVGVTIHQGSVLSPLLFALVVDVSLEEWQEKFRKCKAFESKGMKVNFANTKTMVSGSEGERINSKIDPCGICGKREMAKSLLCTKCGKWIH